jgi:3-vinyl bacteriochlorophyllide hydratase
VLTYLYYIGTLQDFSLVTYALLVKTIFFIVLFVTGCFFEKEVFGIWVFSPEFLWEDIGSTIALAVHFVYFGLSVGGSSHETLLWAAFAAYFSYVANAAQYLVRIWLEKRNERRLKSEGIAVS